MSNDADDVLEAFYKKLREIFLEMCENIRNCMI